MKSNVRIIVALLVLLALCVGGFGLSILMLGRPVDPSGKDIIFTVERGKSVRAITAELRNKGLIRSALYALILTRVNKNVLKAGTYKLSPKMNTAEILAWLESGREETIRVTIPEGLTLRKTAQYLEAAGVVQAQAFIASASDRSLLSEFGIPGPTAEGFLFPDTYFFPYGIEADEVVRLFVSTFFRKVSVPDALKDRPEELFGKVILASIIEREYQKASEAPLIASVFTNRLKIGMGLQSCATIVYIITEIEGKEHPSRLTVSDLAIPSDFNTYLWAGLPPAPISSPGLVALNAAFAPEKSPYLYFRLVDPDTGEHSFSRSLDEHVQIGRDIVVKGAAGR